MDHFIIYVYPNFFFMTLVLGERIEKECFAVLLQPDTYHTLV